jgi:hypothetical protein
MDPDRAVRCYGVHVATAGGSATLAWIEVQMLKAHLIAGPNWIAQLVLLAGDLGVGVGELVMLGIEASECW